MTTNENMQRRWMIRALVVAIFLVGLTLRVHNLGTFPEPNRTADEYAWTWSGMTLLGEGKPRAWSWLPGYSDFTQHTWHGNEYRLVRPWFDHPPLFGLYVGSWMRAAGVRDVWAVELATARASMLPLYAATFFLFFAIARRYGGDEQALLALAFFAAAPTAVWNGRLVMAEQMMLPVALAGWWALLRYCDSRRRGWLVAVGVAAALLPLVKAASLGFALFLFTIAVLRKERLLVVAVCAGASVGLGIWALYGAHYDWKLFREIQRLQSTRFTDFGGFAALILNPRVVEKGFGYLPFILGFMTLLSDLRDGRHAEVGLFGAIYAGAIAFFLPWNMYGWYLMPLYPAMAFGLASFAVRAWREAATGAAWAWLLFSATYLSWILCDANVVKAQHWRFVYLALFVLLPVATIATEKRQRLWRTGFGVLVGLQWLGDAWYSFRK